jgi:hypothetical protein
MKNIQQAGNKREKRAQSVGIFIFDFWNSHPGLP